jgi:hypothetical protein
MAKKPQKALSARDAKYAAKKKTAESLIQAFKEGETQLPKNLTKEQAKEWIKKGSRGRIFACDVIKRLTGTKRHFVCRYGVRSRAKGIGLSFDPEAKQLLVIFDMIADNYRMLNLPGLYGLLVSGKYHPVR